MNRLKKLCGLEPHELARVLENNPRAYMAVKGAVAEEHLNKYLKELGNKGHIVGLKTAQSDFDKDFYVTLQDGREVAVECKNVEVLKTNSNKESLIDYFKYLQITENLFEDISFDSKDDYTTKNLKLLYSSLPQYLRESGIPRYEYSASKIIQQSIFGTLTEVEFLSQFEKYPLSIDFQRTRNSRNKAGVKSDPKTNRFYTLDEIDVVAACLFSRTMKWEFVFGSRDSLIIHPNHEGHYSNRLLLDPKLWKFNFLDVV